MAREVGPGGGRAGAEPAPLARCPRLSARLRRRLLCTLGVLPLLLALFWGSAWLWCARYTPSGDALTDRYARAVIRRQAWRLFLSPHPAVLPDKLLESWELEFGQDSRYWELRYWCSVVMDEDAEYGYLFAEVPSWQLLDQARQRGVASWQALYQLHTHRPAGVVSNVDADIAAMQIPEFLDGDPGRRNPAYLQAVGAIIRGYELMELALLDAAVDAAPDQAWPYYTRAFYHLDLGDESAALADLNAGNSAKDNELPLVFPARAVMLVSSPSWGGPVLRGAILEDSLRSPASGELNYIKLKEKFKEEALRIALRGPDELTQAMHCWTLRFAQTAGGCNSFPYVGAVFDGVLAQAVLDSVGMELQPAQRRALSMILNLKDKLKASLITQSWEFSLRDPGLNTALYLRNVQRVPGLPAGLVDDHDLLASTPRLGEMPLGTQLSTFVLLVAPALRYARLSQRWPDINALRYSGGKNLDQSLLYAYDFTTLDWPASWQPDAVWNWY